MKAESVSDLYADYLKAIDFANCQVNNRCKTDQQREAFQVKTLSQSEFESWWKQVSKDQSCAARWLERFSNPALAFNRLHQQINSNLGEILARRIAA